MSFGPVSLKFAQTRAQPKPRSDSSPAVSPFQQFQQHRASVLAPAPAPAASKKAYPGEAAAPLGFSPKSILMNSGAQHPEEIEHALEILYGPEVHLPGYARKK